MVVEKSTIDSIKIKSKTKTTGWQLILRPAIQLKMFKKVKNHVQNSYFNTF